jgi:hypothetical protein
MSLFLRLAVVAFLIYVSPVQAATIYIDPGVATLNRGDAITASVRIMPDKEAGECINVIDAVVTYTDNIQPVDISIGKSIFNVWVESPVINKENRTITFAGGITNGYCGRVDGDPRLTNIVAEIVFRSPGFMIGGIGENTGPEALIDFAPETQVLLNDGQGTRAELQALGAKFTLADEAGAGIVDDWRELVREDNIPPEEFSITFTRDEFAYTGRYFIVFSTTDKQSGISHYEVMEEPVLEFSSFTWGGADAPWIRVDTNTYELKDQTLNSIIRVKAIDKAGNEYIATYIPEESLQSLSRNEMYTYVFASGAMAIVFGIIIFLVFYLRKQKKITSEVETNEIEN